MKKIIATSLLLILAPLLFLKVASAQLINDPNNLSSITDQVATQANLGQTDIGSVVATIIRVILGLLATVFLILTIFAGFRWMTSAGNEEAITKAKSTITAAIIGLVIVLAAYAITFFIFKALPFGGGSSQSITSG